MHHLSGACQAINNAGGIALKDLKASYARPSQPELPVRPQRPSA